MKNVSVQSICAIYDTGYSCGQVCLLIATRNGDVIIMKESDYANSGKLQEKY